MWNNYPKHELESVKVFPPFDTELEMKENIKVTNPEATSQKEYLNQIFKEKNWMDDI